MTRFFKNRVLVLGLVLVPILIVIIMRMFQLQIVRGQDYYDDYIRTTKREVSIPAMRGSIYDRNGVLLAGNIVTYNVTLTDGNYYSKANGDFNQMILRLIRLLKKYQTNVRASLPVTVDESDSFVYAGSDARVRILIRDVYGAKRIAELSEEGIDAYAYPCEKVMGDLMTLYNFTSRWVEWHDYTNEEILDICNVRYTVAATAFTRYITPVVCSNVSDEVRAAVSESMHELSGVNVEEAYERVYYDSECFSCILGYVGSITTEEIEERNAQGGSYIVGDTIGKDGIESAYETYLQGQKGTKTIYVNNIGMILDEEVTKEPVRGNDVYLSIDAKMTIAAYNVAEQQLAGVVVNHLYEGTDYDPEVAYENANYLLPIRDVFWQMINNNILSVRAFADEKASETEKEMEAKRIARKAEVTAHMKMYLEGHDTKPVNEEDRYMREYVRYLYTYMVEKNYIRSALIDTEDEVYKQWKAEEISFPTFFRHAIASGWVDTAILSEDNRYNSVDTCYDAFTELLLEQTTLPYGGFDKLIYSELIHTDRILGTEIGIALYDQGVLREDREMYEKLKGGDNTFAFEFFKSKINSMEITPAQIALDPCSAGVVLADPNTGRLLAVVSYPGYDANRINDAAYYSKLLSDSSSPLYSYATQSRIAPGSTFKMVTTTAALEGGYVGVDEKITCEGIFPNLDHPRCWIYRLLGDTHGELDFVHAIGQSCNCFFYECGYRLSLNAAGLYSPSTGINALNSYASMYGFGSLSGIEVRENVPTLTTELPVTSAIGQGTYAFTTISLARYVTTIASSGNLYEFKLLDHIADSKGEEQISYVPKVISKLELKDSTWEAIHSGMYMVVHEGGSRNGDFALLRNQFAAKSGSAQENRTRPEHGLYVSYGPYDDIQYALAVQIPYGYSAGNAALISAALYEYLEGDITLEEILENSAASSDVNDIGD